MVVGGAAGGGSAIFVSVTSPCEPVAGALLGLVSQAAATRPTTMTAPAAAASFHCFRRDPKSYEPEGVVFDIASRLRAGVDWLTLRVPESPISVKRPLAVAQIRRRSSASSRADA
jgi:hypothetical protein